MQKIYIALFFFFFFHVTASDWGESVRNGEQINDGKFIEADRSFFEISLHNNGSREKKNYKI